ncbi:hypothetical protein F4778DRAFT_799557 [Xylariomycetidae sp. FL2044]|nr:hypothetical protein F4778DRAFT_799557 [Xylariomycetidae sp. FL2044]
MFSLLHHHHLLFFLLSTAFTPRVSATTYTISIFAPGTEVDGAQLSAAGQAFYSGLADPSTYCPTIEGLKCPEVRGTLVHSGMSGMAVEVPGGQPIYVAPDGQVRFDRAHSVSSPSGSAYDGWYNKTVVQECGPTLEVLDFYPPYPMPIPVGGGGGGEGGEGEGEGGGGRPPPTPVVTVGGVVMCPDIPDYLDHTGASYSLYAVTPAFNLTGCVAAIGLLLKGHDIDYGCWQYE